VATHGKWQRTEPANRDRPAALETETVPAGIEPGDRVVNAHESRRAHFDQRELQCDVDIGVRAFSLIDHFVGSVRPAVAHAVLKVALRSGFEFAERVSKFRGPEGVVGRHSSVILSPGDSAPEACER
jgi:hypothetical protein